MILLILFARSMTAAGELGEGIDAGGGCRYAIKYIER